VPTPTDVYALGGILFELLTGIRAQKIETHTPAEIDRVVCESEPQRPSALARRIPRDLDTIVLKAMQKVPERRYNSVEQFSEDLRRYLEGRPVLARPDTNVYRMRKFIRRHWVGVGPTVAVIAALAAGAGISIHQARLARERFDQVRTLANRFLFDFEDEIASIPGTTKAQQMVVNTAFEYLDKLS